jgi:geranylgeranyl diphosphate synthase type II
LIEKRAWVDARLDELLPPIDREPAILHQAMRYTVFAGGKRVRPILALAVAQALGASADRVAHFAAALECIHTYSLIHDDLPAMDNDDLRRGKPTAHKVFGEAVAILAGDALLTYAFGILVIPECVRTHSAATLLAVTHELARAAGAERLVAGQVLDMQYENREYTEETAERIVNWKTGALIRAACVGGALLAQANTRTVAMCARYGERLGAVFQIRDDLLDLEGDPEKLGKAVRKDNERGKATFPRLIGAEEATKYMNRHVAAAIQEIESLGESGFRLRSIAEYVGRRSH